MDTHKLIALMPDLATFIVIVDEGSYTAASRKLGVTPSALSKQISRLEQSLSVKLLERTTRRLVISESGNRIYEQCTAMIDAAKQAIDISSSEHALPSGTVTIAAPKAFMSIVIQPLVTPFLTQFPQVNLKLKACDGDIDIIANGIDIVFRLTEKPSEGLVLKKVGKVNLMLCASPDYLRRRGVPKHPQELIDHDCLYLGESNTDHIWDFEKHEQQITIPVTGRYAVNHSQMRLNGVKDNLGIGIFPDFVIKNELISGDVIHVLPDWTIRGNYHGDIALQYSQTKFMPARIRTVIDYFTTHLTLY
jgi:DNA-binding transcriptional LysR family regulator